MKRGQITTFLIIAILLVIAGGILVYTDVLQTRMAREQISYPEGVQPIANFVSECVQQVAVDGVGLLGQQGGYIELPASIERDQRKFLPMDTLNLRKIPYWVQEGEIRYPTLRYMEEQLNSYIQENAMECFDGFRAFTQYEITPQGEMVVESVMSDNDVYIQVYYPLKAKQGTREYDIDKYNTVVDARVKGAYELASQIAEFQHETKELENLTINFLAIDPEIPMDDLSFSCNEESWNIIDIQNRLQYVLKNNMQNIRIRNTMHFPFTTSEGTYNTLQRAKARMDAEMIAAEETIDIEDTRAYPTETPIDAFEYNNMYFDVGANDNNMQALFQYDPTYGMNMNIVPNDNGILRSGTVRGPDLLRFLCMQQYHFLYDVQYPVKVTVRDPESFGGDGYLFEFAMFITVDDNAASPGIFTHNQYESFVDEDFCNELGYQTYDLRAIGFDEYGYNTELSDINITYECARRRCEMGRTAARSGIYRLLTRLPSGCENPYILASGDGYLPGREQIDTERESVARVPVTKLKEMDLEVVKHRYFSRGNEMGPAEPLEELEEVTLMLSIPEHDHIQYVTYTNETTIELIDGDGNYAIDAFLTRRDLMLGGYRAENITIQYNNIAGRDTMVLHVFEWMPTPFTDGAQESMMLYMIGENYNLRPDFR